MRIGEKYIACHIISNIAENIPKTTSCLQTNTCPCLAKRLRTSRFSWASIEDLNGAHVVIDGYNFLITIESLLGGGILIRGRDGCIRDLAGIHGTYRYVEETLPAIDLAGRVLRSFGVAHAEWLLDAPVSNSGRLKALLADQAVEHEWDWDVRLSKNVDTVLAQNKEIVVTADSWILDRAERWVSLADHLIEKLKQPVRIIDLA
ncbi:MAG: DUF5616 domain-containing protein [Candidatus Hydrogenedentes bacterium]|nr:DUF5616 domain-containing protein [Candidatus Hydrogenedentota bacterium]